MLTDTSFHRRSNPQGLMDPREIVMHVEQRNHVDVVVDLLAEGVREASKAAHVHSHVQVLPFYIAGRDVSLIGIATDSDTFGAKTLRRAVTALRFGSVAVNFHQLSKVYSRSESIGHGSQVHLVAIGSQLDAVCEPAFNVPKEFRCTPGVPRSYEPTDNQLGLSINRSEGPYVTADSVTFDLLDCHVLVFATNEGPDFVNLDAACFDVADRNVLVVGARLANFLQQAENGAFGNASHAGSRANGATLNQCRDDRDPLVHAQLVHTNSMHYRFSISKWNRRFCWLFYGFLCCFLRAPSLLGRCLRDLRAALLGHSLKAALPADPSAFAPHLCHHKGNRGSADGYHFERRFGSADSFVENPPGILDYIKARIRTLAISLWHTAFSVTRFGAPRQLAVFSVGFSN